MESETSAAEMSAQAASRSTTYGFLAWLFLEDPDTGFLERIRAAGDGFPDPLRPAAEEMGPAILAGLADMRGYLSERSHLSPAEACLELAIQRTRLFRGVAPGYGPPPPYEAVYRCPQACTEPELMLRVQSFYREAGVELPPDQAERLDYLGLELDLMRFLCAEESSLWDAGDVEGAARLRGMQGRFLRGHLLAWGPRFCETILAEPGVRFYHGVARILAGFLAEEAARL